jgi:hypothetical protein
MSVVTATFLSNSLFYSVPKLESTSTNWAIFKICFHDAIKAKGFCGHFDRTSVCPVAIFVTAPDKTTSIDNTPVDQWDKDECSAKSLLNQKILDSTLMHILYHFKSIDHHRSQAMWLWSILVQCHMSHAWRPSVTWHSGCS